MLTPLPFSPPRRAPVLRIAAMLAILHACVDDSDDGESSGFGEGAWPDPGGGDSDGRSSHGDEAGSASTSAGSSSETGASASSTSAGSSSESSSTGAESSSGSSTDGSTSGPSSGSSSSTTSSGSSTSSTSSSGGSSSSTSSSGGSTSSSSSSGDPGDPWGEARQDCVDRINGFRATEGKPPLARWTAAESCTDDQARRDSQSGEAHANFGDCDEYAQNTCPGWDSIDSIIQNCLQSMWDEGPGEPFEEHGHYLNMSSTEYSRVACGFYTMQNGEIWHNHNFQ